MHLPAVLDVRFFFFVVTNLFTFADLTSQATVNDKVAGPVDNEPPIEVRDLLFDSMYLHGINKNLNLQNRPADKVEKPVEKPTVLDVSSSR